MSRKHYVAIAANIMRNREAGLDGPTLDNVARGLAQVFITDNACFDSTRFLTACGVKF